MRKHIFNYGFAVILAGSAFLFRQWFGEQFGSTLTYIFLYPAVLIVAMLAGAWPGLLATAISAVLAAIWIFPPIGRPWPLSTADLLGLGIFSLMAVLMCVMTGLYHRAQRKVRVLEKEKATRESEERFRTMADNIAQLAWMADEKGNRFWFNQRWFDYTGTTLEAVQGWGWQKVHHPEHVQRVLDKIGHCFRAGEIWEDTFPLRGQDGAYRWFLSRAIPIHDESGKVERWFGTNTDVTELRQAEAALRVAKEAAEAANRAKDEFLARMSHELRTPITVIMGTLEHLLTSGFNSGRRDLLEMADSSAHRLLGIIDDLLDITRIETHQLQIKERPFTLRETIREIAGIFAKPAREKGLRLRWEVAPQLPARFIGDPDRLGQILMNLIGNAVKFTGQGEVAVTVDGTEERLEILVRDTGVGIPADRLERIFEPFNQVDSSVTRRHGGTGLGLAICRELVGLMGGTIRVISSEIGRGSLFCVSLPLRTADAAGPAAQPEKAPAPETTGGVGRILLAEDEPLVRDLVVLLLRQRGWDVAVVENGRQAVARWQKGGIDLVLMDIQMPEMDGLEATRQIRRMEGERQVKTPIFALTAHAREENRRECLDAGMDGVLTKPFRIENLYSLLESRPGGKDDLAGAAG